MNKAKLYKITNITLSILLGMLAIFYIYTLFINKINLNDFESAVTKLVKHPLLLSVVLLLMPINWLIEIFKWNLTINKFQQLRFYQSILSVAVGILLGLLTPNRTGELAGRLLFIDKQHKANVLYSNILCAISQLQITIIMGLFATIYYVNTIAEWLKMNPHIVVLAALGALLLSLFLFFASNFLNRIVQFFANKLKRKTYITLGKFDIYKRLELLGLSLLRFIIFALQFIVLLKLFETNLKFIDGFMIVALLYFSMAIIPSTWLTELPIRFSLGYFIFELLDYDGISAVVVAFVIWMVNLILPALVGLFALPNINWVSWFKSKQL